MVYTYVKYFLPILFLMTLIPAAALWSESLRVNVVVTVRVANLDIGSWRVFLNYTCDVCRGIRDDYVNLSEDYDTIYVYLDNRETNNVWVGLVIENNYGIPATLEGLKVSFRNASGTYELSGDDYSIYPYEPVKDGVGNKPYWGYLSCGDLPISDYLTELPITIESGWKAVVWVNVSTYGMTNGDLIIELTYDSGSS